MLAIGQLRAIAALFKNQKKFLVLNTRHGNMDVCKVYLRAYSKTGLIPVKLELARTHPPNLLALQLKIENAPLAVIYKETDYPKELFEALFRENITPELITAADDGRLYHKSKPLKIRTQKSSSYAHKTRLTLHVQKETLFRDINLPLEVEVKLPKDDVNASIIGLSAFHPIDPMPDAVWYRLEGPPNGKLKIDVLPDDKGDDWDVTYADSPDNVFLIEIDYQPEEYMPERLVVILDRTCPDDAHWSDARTLLSGQVADTAAASGTSSYDKKPESAPDKQSAVVTQNDMNREIRTALGQALKEAAGSHNLIIDGWWFADVPGDGIDTPAGVSCPQFSWGSLQELPAKVADNLFDSATYSPGLDLWDCLEEALEKALDKLEQDNAGHSAVLIVGNSPPNMSLAPNSPLKDINEALGFSTSFRRFNDEWREQLERCRQENITVYYLFLTHEHYREQEEDAHNVFRTIQDKVRSSLSRSVTLISQRADTQGIKTGLKTIFELLPKPPEQKSKVKVER